MAFEAFLSLYFQANSQKKKKKIQIFLNLINKCRLFSKVSLKFWSVNKASEKETDRDIRYRNIKDNSLYKDGGLIRNHFIFMFLSMLVFWNKNDQF